MEKPTLVPLDFNSLSAVKAERLKLSDYYIDYAFNSENIHPMDRMSITFYAERWTSNPNEIVCLDAILRKGDAPESWGAELKGQIYTSIEKPSRKYYSSFVGASTQRMAQNPGETAEQKVGDDPTKNKLAGVSCFMFAKGSRLPDFSKIVGLDMKELHNFFQFKESLKPQLENGEYSSDTLIVRGGK